MGKETVQNVLALRFANAIFEPIWNRRYVDHVQITVAEELGVEHRGGFYETAGALRDIVQNHVMQVLALTLMEPPATVDAQGIRDEKVKLLRAVVIPDVDEAVINSVRGQYTRRASSTVTPSSATARRRASTRGAAPRPSWPCGWPWTTGAGPASPSTSAPASASLSAPPRSSCSSSGSPTSPSAASSPATCVPNMLQLRIQPDEGICLLFGAKVPGEAFRLRSVDMDFSYAEAFPGTTAGGYERLLHDVMVGDATLFIRTDEVERAWQIVDPLLEAWSQDGVPLSQYAAGTWGPKEADSLLTRELRQWHEP